MLTVGNQHEQNRWFRILNLVKDFRNMCTTKSMYKKLKSCVKIDGNLTPYFDCSIGTRQGCVASPKIFSLFINDLVDYLSIKNERGIFVTQDINELNVLMF